MREPAVSVIIIFYNAERFLAEAINSVLQQSDPNWELLLCDDGSLDASAQIARDYAARGDGRIRYIEHPDHENRGMSATRNLGIQSSRGEWVAFLDADDFWLPYKLAEQQALLRANPDAALLYGSPLYWFSWSSELVQFPDCQPGISVPPESLVSPPVLFFRNYPLGPGPAPCPSDLIIRKSAIEILGGFEESFRGIYQMYEDQAFLIKAYLSIPAFVSGRCFVRYRQHPTACSIAGRDSGNYLEARRFFLEYLQRYLRAQRITDGRIWQAVARAWWPYRHPYLAAAKHFYRGLLKRSRYAFQSEPQPVL
jgi:glycosyltransferase involved in cell wall biosynthesis